MEQAAGSRQQAACVEVGLSARVHWEVGCGERGVSKEVACVSSEEDVRIEIEHARKAEQPRAQLVKRVGAARGEGKLRGGRPGEIPPRGVHGRIEPMAEEAGGGAWEVLVDEVEEGGGASVEVAERAGGEETSAHRGGGEAGGRADAHAGEGLHGNDLQCLLVPSLLDYWYLNCLTTGTLTACLLVP